MVAAFTGPRIGCTGDPEVGRDGRGQIWQTCTTWPRNVTPSLPTDPPQASTLAPPPGHSQCHGSLETVRPKP